MLLWEFGKFAAWYLYTGGNFQVNVWKKSMEIWDLINDHDLTNQRLLPKL